MRHLLGDRATGAHEDPQAGGFDRNDTSEINPPEPLLILTRLGLLVVVALAFGLAAELLARAPLN